MSRGTRRRPGPAARPRESFRGTWLRALLLPGLVFAIGVSYLVASQLLEANSATTTLLDRDGSARTDWRASYSRAFPDCVPLVLWPEQESPAGFVLRRSAGSVQRVSLAEAYRALRHRHSQPGPTSVEVLGACHAR